MKIPTSQLTGDALDWIVSRIEHPEWYEKYPTYVHSAVRSEYSTDWDRGGPIIERECISIAKEGEGEWAAWSKSLFRDEAEAFGYHPTSPLIAAMRCYVASKLGDEVVVPEELQ